MDNHGTRALALTTVVLVLGCSRPNPAYGGLDTGGSGGTLGSSDTAGSTTRPFNPPRPTMSSAGSTGVGLDSSTGDPPDATGDTNFGTDTGNDTGTSTGTGNDTTDLPPLDFMVLYRSDEVAGAFSDQPDNSVIEADYICSLSYALPFECALNWAIVVGPGVEPSFYTNFEPDIPVEGPGGAFVANNLGNLVNGVVAANLVQAGVAIANEDRFWTGINGMGGFGLTCEGWTNPAAQGHAIDPVYVPNPLPCVQERPLLCFCAVPL